MADALPLSRDAPNPLRPYYIPPSIGLPPELPPTSHASHASHTSNASHSPAPSYSFGSQARDMLSDLDYDSYFPGSSPTVAEHARKLLDQALWNYTSILLAQPFDVAKTLLQIHEARGQLAPPFQPTPSSSRPDSFASGRFGDYLDAQESEESDDDAPGYFTSTAPRSAHAARSRSRSHSRSPSPKKRGRSMHSRSTSETPTRAAPPPARRLELKQSDALLEVIGQLWQKESAWGVWKATNCTFIYNFLLKTTESWFRSLLSALLNVPDPGLVGAAASGMGGLDIAESPNPLMSLAVAVTATAIAATVLAPLDLVRTRLIVTPISAAPRSIYPCLSLLPSISVPSSLLPATILHACVPTLISSSSPLLLRSTLSIDPLLTPTTYSVSTFFTSITELFARLPLETVLRRGQVAALQDHENQRLATSYRTAPAPRSSNASPHPDPSLRSFHTIVDPAPYRGVLGTMWFVMREEGITVVGPTPSKAASAKSMGFERPLRTRRGQGVKGLWRGWRVGVWGLVGVWGAAAMGGGGGEF